MKRLTSASGAQRIERVSHQRGHLLRTAWYDGAAPRWTATAELSAL